MTTYPGPAGAVVDGQAEQTRPDLTPGPMVCPRCHQPVVERFYGPCSACREQLRATVVPPAPKAANVPATRPAYGDATATRVRWRVKERTAAFVDMAAGEIRCAGESRKVRKNPPAAALLAAIPDGVSVVYTVGPAPASVEKLRRWSLRAADQGQWTPGNHYLAKPEMPVLRFTNGERRVEIHRAAAWLGEGQFSPAAAEAAMGAATAAIAARFGGAVLLSSPGATGRYLWAAVIPEGTEIETLTAEHQELIRATSGQGRVECFTKGGGQIPGLVQLDMRWAYAALCRELPCGPAVHIKGELPADVRADLRKAKGRYRVRFVVPSGWSGPGLLGVKHNAGGWWYPNREHEVHETWCDAVELWLADKHGWKFAVMERLELRPGRPLDGWAERLIGAREDLGRAVDRGELAADIGELAAKAVRAVLIKGIGSFVGRPKLVTRTAPVDQPELVPAGAIHQQLADDAFVWQEVVPERQAAWVHPEWAATVYARCRVRILHAPGPAGALHLPAGVELVAADLDALYLTGDPGWPDDGKVGRYRVKATRTGPLPAPGSMVEARLLVKGA